MSIPKVLAPCCAIFGQPKRGLRRLSSQMAWISSGEGPFGPGVFFGQEDAGLRHRLDRGVTKGLPHVHDRQINAPAFLDSQFREEQGQARFRGIRTTEPDRSPRSEEHTSELQSLRHLVCRLLLE